MSHWIWSDPADTNPVNRFTYFRTTFDLDTTEPLDHTLHFAASTNAQLFLNGVPLRRKVTRFHERHLRAEVIDVSPHLVDGVNVLVALHHHWGPVQTFQRHDTSRAGLYYRAAFLNSSRWRWHDAPQFARHTEQFVGIAGEAKRLRFPVILDTGALIPNLHSPKFDDSGWRVAYELHDGPWPAFPLDVEIPAQRELPVLPGSVLAAGRLLTAPPASPAPLEIAGAIARARVEVDAGLTSASSAIVSGQTVSLRGEAGTSLYLTLDFHRPVHGFPRIRWANRTGELSIDLGYAETARRQYDGKSIVHLDGRLDPEAVVGKGYADRVLLRGPASGEAELPDERTARWVTLHVHFLTGGQVDLGFDFISSQYPVAPVGSFHSEDLRVNQAVRLCDTHARVTMIDGYVDTPGREDGCWIEDARLRARIAATWYGDDLLRQFLIRLYAEAIHEDGTSHPFPPSNYPMGHPRMTAPADWAFQWIGLLHDQYLWSGDTALASRYWDQLLAMIRHFAHKIGPDGRWHERWVLADIRLPFGLPTEQHTSGTVTPFFIAALEEAITLAKALGKTLDANHFAETHARLVQGFKTFHLARLEPEGLTYVPVFHAPDVPLPERGYSQAAQLLPTTLGLLPKEEAARTLAYFFDPRHLQPKERVWRWNNPTYFHRALHALTHAGLTDLAFAHFHERFAQFLPACPANPLPLVLQGTDGGPLPEYGITREDLGLAPGAPNPQQPEDDTGSHGWYATPMVWLHEHVLGVRPLKPGYEEVLIHPPHAFPASQPFVAGLVHTPRGVIGIELDAQHHRMHVRLPSGIQAEIRPPADWRVVRA